MRPAIIDGLRATFDPHGTLNPGRIFTIWAVSQRSIFSARSSISSRSWPQKISADGNT
jgi:hypothetical protein